MSDNKVYARIDSLGNVLEYPILDAEITSRSVPRYFYSEVIFGAKPVLKSGQVLVEVRTVSAGVLYISYTVDEQTLDKLIAMFARSFQQDQLPMAPDQYALMTKMIEDKIQARLDTFATGRGYASMDRLASYVTSKVESRRVEAQRGVELRDDTWDAWYTYLADVNARKVVTVSTTRSNGTVVTTQQVTQPPSTMAAIYLKLPALVWEAPLSVTAMVSTN